MLKRIAALVLAASVLLASPLTRAADLPAKTPGALSSLLAYPTGNGFFWGLSASGLGGTTGSGFGPGNLIGGKIGLDVGYTGTLGSGFYFIEHNFNLQGIQGPGGAQSVSAAFGMQQRYAIGASQSTVNQFVNLVPGLGSVAMPSVPLLPGVTLAPANYYLFASTYEDDVSASVGTSTGRSWLFSYGVGTGILFRGSNGWVFDTSIEWKHSEGGMLIGAAGTVKPLKDAYLGTVRVKF